jgi:hypothetical protein
MREGFRINSHVFATQKGMKLNPVCHNPNAGKDCIIFGTLSRELT